MADETGDRLDFALDLMLREMEIYAASYQSIRNNIQTLITLAVTIDAILITSVFARPSTPSTGSLVLSFLVLGVLLIGGVVAMWMTPSALSWPEGFAVGMEKSGSAADGKRQLVTKMETELGRVSKNLKRYQLAIFPMLLLLMLSIASWIWMLKAPEPKTTIVHPTTTSMTVTRRVSP